MHLPPRHAEGAVVLPLYFRFNLSINSVKRSRLLIIDSKSDACVIATSSLPISFISASEVGLLSINCAISSLGTLGGDRLGVLMRHRYMRRLALEIMTEVVAIARASGVRLEKVSGTLDLDWIALTDAERHIAGSPGLFAKHALLLAQRSTGRVSYVPWMKKSSPPRDYQAFTVPPDLETVARKLFPSTNAGTWDSDHVFKVRVLRSNGAALHRRGAPVALVDGAELSLRRFDLVQAGAAEALIVEDIHWAADVLRPV